MKAKKRRRTSLNRNGLIKAVLACAMSLLAVLDTSTAQAGEPKDKQAFNPGNPIEKNVQTYIVHFNEPGAMHYSGGLPGLPATAPDKTGAAKFDTRSKSVQTYLSYLVKTQSQHLDELQALLGRELKIRHAYTLTASGIAAEFSAQEAALITKWLGFKTYADTYYQLDTFRGPSYIGADSIWRGSSTPAHTPHLGVGTTIGVIDTGFNSAHPSFGAMPPICNGDRYGPFLKVLSAVDCTYLDGGACASTTRRGDTTDYVGHGSHTASTAAGNALTNTLFNTETSISVPPIPSLPAAFPQMSGVAPCANLRIYKVCSLHCAGSDIQAAQESAIADAVDVLNFSMSASDDSNPWELAPELGFLDALNAGIVVTTTAGNAPAGAYTGGSVHHIAPWVMTVAASSHDNAVVLPGSLSATGPDALPPNTQNLALYPSDLPLVNSPLINAELRSWPGNPSACGGSGPLPASGYFNRGIALLASGSCPVSEQVNNARNADASAVVVYSTITGDSPGPALEGDVAAIPVYGVNAIGGRALLDALNVRGNRILISLVPPRGQGDVLGDYSLRGPNYFFDVTKPDIAAPGTQIYAAYIASHRPSNPTVADNYTYLSGTSMAAPHVAGAAALVREAHPEWTAAEVMSALRLTAVESGTKEDGTTPWNPDDVGNGRVDLTRAALAALVMDETYAHFRDANPTTGGDPKTLNLPSVRNTSCGASCAWTRVVRNGSTSSTTWNATTFDTPYAAIAISPTTFTLAPRGSPGDTQILTITARPTSTGNNLGFGNILLRSSSDPSLPAEHITVAAQHHH